MKIFERDKCEEGQTRINGEKSKKEAEKYCGSVEEREKA